jgi:hypothetical protein
MKDRPGVVFNVHVGAMTLTQIVGGPSTSPAVIADRRGDHGRARKSGLLDGTRTRRGRDGEVPTRRTETQKRGCGGDRRGKS